MGQLQHDGLHATAVLLVGFSDGNKQHREGTSGIVPSCLIVGDTECVVINLFHGSADDFYMRPVGGVVVSPFHVCAVGIGCLQIRRRLVSIGRAYRTVLCCSTAAAFHFGRHQHIGGAYLYSCDSGPSPSRPSRDRNTRRHRVDRPYKCFSR